MPLFINPNTPFFDETVTPMEPVRSGYLFFFEPGTSAPKAVYLESTENNIANDAQGKIQLDGDGRLPQLVFYSGLAAIELRRSDGVTVVWRKDNVPAGGGSAGTGSAAQYIEFRYQRAPTQPVAPTGDNPAGWVLSPPADDGNPLWMTQSLKLVATGALVGSWSTPVRLTGAPGATGVLLVEYSVNGVDGWHAPPFQIGDRYMRQDLGTGFGPAILIVGEDGADGPYFSFLFQRAAAQPATPPAGDPAPVGWFDAPPVAPAGLPLWMVFAQLSADGATVLIPWSVPVNVRGDDGLDGADGESLQVEYSPNGVDSWHGPPFVAGDMYMRQRLGAGSFGPPIKILGEDGSNGPFTSFIFRRAATQPATPTGANPSGWFDGPPTGTNPLWFSTATKLDAGTLLTAWTTPQRLTGIDGADGASLEVEYSVNGVDGWHAPPFVAGSDRYMRQRIGSTGAFSTPFLIVGEDGSNGDFWDFRFRRAATQPATPTGDNPANWFDSPPAGSNPLWMVRAVKNAAGNLITPWSTPIQLNGNQGPQGDPGADGDSLEVEYSADGVSGWHGPPFVVGDRYMRQRIGSSGPFSAPFLIVGENGANGEFWDFRFRRSATQPATPTGNNPSGWSDDPAAAPGTGKLWMIRGRKTAQGNLIGVWSTPVRLEGEDGVDGGDGTSVTVIERNSQEDGSEPDSGASSVVHPSQGSSIEVTVRATGIGGWIGTPPNGATLRLFRGATEIGSIDVGLLNTQEPVGEGGGTINLWQSNPGLMTFVVFNTPGSGNQTFSTTWSASATNFFSTALRVHISTKETVVS